MNRSQGRSRYFSWCWLPFFAACVTLFAVAGCGSSGAKTNSNLLEPESSSSLSSGAVLSSTSSVISASSSSAQSTSSQAMESVLVPVKDFYGLYAAVGRPGENGMLGNAAKEQTFLTFVRDNGFNYLILYDLFNEDFLVGRAAQVASLILRAKTQYGVQQVAVALGTRAGADAVIAYNSGRPAAERIDVLNLEYEFWNETERSAAFEHALQLLRYFHDVGQPDGLAVEAYIGWISEQEGAALAKVLDRVLVHYYRPNDIAIFEFGMERLQYLAAGRSATDAPLVVSPIFSNEGPLNTNDLPFMGTWLETNPHERAYQTWHSAYTALNASWKSALTVEGATWFIYDKFLDVRDLQSHITLHPQSQQLCEGASASLTVATSVTQAGYCWMYNSACLKNGGSVSGADSATLVLANLSAVDAGEYYARVTSEDASNPQTFASTVATISLDMCE